jgi:hypothetical protein
MTMMIMTMIMMMMMRGPLDMCTGCTRPGAHAHHHHHHHHHRHHHQSSSSSLSSSSSQSTTTIWKGGGLADILISNNCDDNIEFIPFDPDLDINEHPKYDIIIHKLTEDILINSDKIISLQRYLISNPKCVIIDPIDNVRKVYSI